MENEGPETVESIKRNITNLKYIVLVILFALLFVQLRFTFTFLDYVPMQSVITLLAIVAVLVLAGLILVKITAGKAITGLENYDDRVKTLLIAKQKEINERKMAEEGLRKARDDLEKRVRERTSMLSEAVGDLKTQITEREKVEEQLERQAFYDPLTNLPNRTLFVKNLEIAAERNKREEKYQFAVLFIDLDRFKIVNDSLGHMVGDQLLIAVARRLESCLRPYDMVYRFGGDEFSIFIDGIREINEAPVLAERIQKELRVSFDLNGQDIFITASIGIAKGDINHTGVEGILRDADIAMYRAKALGRARYEIFDIDMHKSSVKLLELEADLRRAVERMEFIVHYQPVVSLANRRIIGVEALIRWDHPEKGLIPPMEFIPLAEETGLILTIGEYILRTACDQNSSWQNMGFENLILKVNFSSRQFNLHSLPGLVKTVLQETGMAAQYLDIEITESIAMEDHSIDVLNELTSMGVQTSIDDFGTGFSSLGSLKRFPIISLKIDKSFVSDITRDSNVAALVEAIIAMAAALKMKVIAEGVETEEQLKFLYSHKCDEIQGYLCSPPKPAEEITKMLKDGWLLSI